MRDSGRMRIKYCKFDALPRHEKVGIGSSCRLGVSSTPYRVKQLQESSLVEGVVSFLP